jgi:endonuclease III
MSPGLRRTACTMNTKLTAVDEALAEVFGRCSATWQPADPLAELIEAILNQRTTNAHARRAMENLRSHCAGWADVAALPYDLCVDLVRPAGLAKQKAGWVLGILQKVALDTGAFSLDCLKSMPTPEAYRYLCTLPGVGAHTASLVLLFALGRPGVMPVDGHVRRVARRLGWAAHDASAKAVQQAVEGMARSAAPDGVAEPAAPGGAGDISLMDLHVNLIRLGHRHCGPSTLDCRDCPVSDICPTALRQSWW